MIIHVGDYFINLEKILYAEPTTVGLDVYFDGESVSVTGEPAKYFRQILDAKHALSLVELNKNLKNEIK